MVPEAKKPFFSQILLASLPPPPLKLLKQYIYRYIRTQAEQISGDQIKLVPLRKETEM